MIFIKNNRGTHSESYVRKVANHLSRNQYINIFRYIRNFYGGNHEENIHSSHTGQLLY